MKPHRLAKVATLAAAALLGAGATNAPKWNTVVAEADGGHRIGNPEAKVSLVEFVSYTCPHCGEFARSGETALQLAYIGSGKVRFEVRHFVRDPVDLTATMLARCGPAAKFPRNHAALMYSQDKWLHAASHTTAGQRQRWATGDGPSRRRAIANDLGLYKIMEGRGYRRTDADACLNDEAAARKIAETSARDVEAWKIKGTPTFAIDGVVLAGTHDWRTLQPQLDARF